MRMPKVYSGHLTLDFAGILQILQILIYYGLNLTIYLGIPKNQDILCANLCASMSVNYPGIDSHRGLKSLVWSISLRYDLLDIRLIFVSFSWYLTSFSNWHWKPPSTLNLDKSHFLCPSCSFIASHTKIQHVWSNCSSFFSSFAIVYSDDYQSFIPRGQNGKRMDTLNKRKMEENTFECVMPMDELLHMILLYSDTLFWYSHALIIMAG